MGSGWRIQADLSTGSDLGRAGPQVVGGGSGGHSASLLANARWMGVLHPGRMASVGSVKERPKTGTLVASLQPFP